MVMLAGTAAHHVASRTTASVNTLSESSMDYAIRIALAVSLSGWAALVGFDRDRVFYPTVLVAIASYYVLFAVMSGSVQAMLIESLVMSAFASLAVLGFKGRLWIVAATLAGHGVFDAVHGSIVTNPGVPEGWPAFCLAFDVTAASAMIWSLNHRHALAKELWQPGS
jgi:hypothetical protein